MRSIRTLLSGDRGIRTPEACTSRLFKRDPGCPLVPLNTADPDSCSGEAHRVGLELTRLDGQVVEDLRFHYLSGSRFGNR